MSDIARGLSLLLPEAALAAGFAAILVADLVLPAARRGLGAWLGILACGVGLCLAAHGGHGQVQAMLSVDSLSALARPGILLATALVLMAGRASGGNAPDSGTWAATVVALGFGALVTASATSLISLYLGLEVMSLSGYALAGWSLGGDARRAAESGMKYVIFGGAASGLMLFGMSHVYGLSGHLDFAGIGIALDGAPVAVLAALCLAGVGIAFKLAVVPFHFYAPDVYQGAPPLGVAAVGTLPKIAAAAVLIRFLALAVPSGLAPAPALGGVLAAIAVASLLVSAFTALAATDAKRIVAFSAIGHAGAVVLAIACFPGATAAAAAAFYLAGYAVANIGALVCLDVLERERGSCSLAALAGAAKSRPWLTAALCLFLFSLAGVPPLAGFLAKWGVLREALRVGLGEAGRGHMTWAALALLASTAISAWAYLLVVRAAVLQPAPEAPRPARLAPGTVVVLAACAAATIALGLWLDGFAVLAAILRS